MNKIKSIIIENLIHEIKEVQVTTFSKISKSKHYKKGSDN